jgi:predicted N-acetyltransferase YhbS
VIQIKTVTTPAEIQAIKSLQDANLRKNLDEQESINEGFVSAEYTIDFLKAMNDERPSIIATDNHQIAGYALVTLRSAAAHHPLLKDLFQTIDKTNYKDRLLKNSKYVVVGQLCVAKEYRGMGLVQQMYQKFKDSLHQEFEYCITDVAQANPRSLKAHLKTGFKVIQSLSYGGISWDIVLWDWNTEQPI